MNNVDQDGGRDNVVIKYNKLRGVEVGGKRYKTLDARSSTSL